MAQHPRVLIQLDTDQCASAFDAIVALDAGAEQLLQYPKVTADAVEPLVHGAIFTRGGEHLAQTAIFIGGSDIAAGEQVLRTVLRTFLGPLRVSVMLDSNGSNTTAVAAVLAAARHVELAGGHATILGATGPVGQRIAALLVADGGQVTLVSRSRSRAESFRESLAAKDAGSESRLSAISLDDHQALAHAYQRSQAVFSAGAAGVSLTRLADLTQHPAPRVAIDLNAVPPVGIDGIDSGDCGTKRDGLICYGALGVGRTKMKVHREAIRRLFTRNDLALDAAELLAIGRDLTNASQP